MFNFTTVIRKTTVLNVHISKQNFVIRKRDSHEIVEKGQHLQDHFEALPSRH